MEIYRIQYNHLNTKVGRVPNGYSFTSFKKLASSNKHSATVAD